jgi:hypothetical protein
MTARSRSFLGLCAGTGHINRPGLTPLRRLAYVEITTTSSRRRTGQIAGFLRLASSVSGYYPDTRDMALCQSSHPGKLRFTSRDKGLSGISWQVTNKGDRLDAVVAAGACQPYSFAVGGFGFDPFEYGATAMNPSHQGQTLPETLPSNVAAFDKDELADLQSIAIGHPGFSELTECIGEQRVLLETIEDLLHNAFFPGGCPPEIDKAHRLLYLAIRVQRKLEESAEEGEAREEFDALAMFVRKFQGEAA